ncbi:tol-pal system protein YbgF [Desulfovibrio ferrophilus]|uniref:Tol-pal system protein YbgF n=1 Tax=Desulfovibrio ferrophilus TaxID=241368 RepID=A0A2Z6AVH6_9BACT|nr:tol-pal system protein YbgF [Desulfovibrio ferrophilus]BBD07220.1 Tol-pal system protein YbgF [Desulfovibrio ferrophilus]
MVRFVIVATTLVALLMTCGCSARSSSESASGASEEWRLRNLEEKSLQFQNAQMELASRLNSLEGRVQDLEAAPRLGEQDIRPQETKPEPLMTSDDLPTPGPVMKKEEPAKPSDWDKYPDATAKTKAMDKTATDKAMKAAAKPASKPASKKYSIKKPAAPAGKAAYDKALKLILAGKTESGRNGMEAFLKSNPKSTLAPNAHYWLGESWYHQKRYAESIVAFKQVHQQYPKHDKAAAALLKIGYAYAALGDRDNARFYLEVLTQDYPKSEPASLARNRLKKLK